MTRDEWCALQQLTQLWAVFGPGEGLRCPGLRDAGGRRLKCGNDLPGRPNRVSRAIVRIVGPQAAASTTAGLENKCVNCGNRYEVFPVLEAAG